MKKNYYSKNRQNILEVDGECASLSKVVRACAILMNYANKKIMNENQDTSSERIGTSL